MNRPRGWIRRLLPFLHAYRRQAVLTIAAALTGLAVTALTPVIQKVIVDDVILARRRPLAPWLAVLVGAGLFRREERPVCAFRHSLRYSASYGS